MEVMVIILATGNWVEDKYMENGILYEYLSDYDFLIVTKDSKEKEHIITDKIINRSRNLFRVPVNPIMHDITYINEGFELGQYFFSDIVKEGVLLFDTENVAFAEARTLTTEEQKKKAQEYFDQHFESACKFLRYGKFAIQDALSRKEKLNEAAFQLHQSAERFYNTVLLVFSGYKPKTHSLEKLRQHVKLYSKEIFEIFPGPTDDKQLEHLFDLLKKGYIDARYKPEYSITEEELPAIVERLGRMKEVVEKTCSKKIETI